MREWEARNCSHEDDVVIFPFLLFDVELSGVETLNPLNQVFPFDRWSTRPLGQRL